MKLYAALAAAILIVGPAHSANVIDLSTVTCRQFFEMRRDQINMVLAWMQSNYQGEDDAPRLDLDKLNADGQKLQEYCAKNPNTNVIDAADELFEK